MREQIEDAVRLDVTILITGPTGAGKELVAREIHRRSRAERPFVAVSLVADTEALLPSALFGHERGAFTGAERRQLGYAREARDGSLFLDEIGELSPTVQPKLLRLLEARMFRPVGADADVSFDARVLTATHRNLPSDVENGSFRRDLYFRIARHVVEVPALDDRREDFRAIARSIVPALELTEPAWRALEARSYPGNVRELEALLERIAARAKLNGSPRIDADDVRAAAGTGPRKARPATILADLAQRLGASLDDLAEARLLVAEQALEAAGGNFSQAARACLVPLSTFRDLLKRPRRIALIAGTRADRTPPR